MVLVLCLEGHSFGIYVKNNNIRWLHLQCSNEIVLFYPKTNTEIVLKWEHCAYTVPLLGFWSSNAILQYVWTFAKCKWGQKPFELFAARLHLFGWILDFEGCFGKFTWSWVSITGRISADLNIIGFFYLTLENFFFVICYFILLNGSSLWKGIVGLDCDFGEVIGSYKGAQMTSGFMILYSRCM